MTLKKALTIVRPMEVDQNLRLEQRRALETLTLALDGKFEYEVRVKATAEVSDSVTVFAASPEDAAILATRHFADNVHWISADWQLEKLLDAQAIAISEVTADEDEASEVPSEVVQ